jgi:Na+/H+ antiporter NhaD/arsenite permease-like protein
MQIEPWQIPVLGMALLALPAFVSYWVPGRRTPKFSTEQKRPEWLRLAIFAVVTVVLTVLFIVALGTELADVVTSVAAAVAALISAVVAVRSGKDLNRHAAGSGVPQAGGDGEIGRE